MLIILGQCVIHPISCADRAFSETTPILTSPNHMGNVTTASAIIHIQMLFYAILMNLLQKKQKGKISLTMMIEIPLPEQSCTLPGAQTWNR